MIRSHFRRYLATSVALAVAISFHASPAGAEAPNPEYVTAPELHKVESPPWSEAGPAVVFTADDGYSGSGNTVDFFNLLDSKQLKGTFFWPVGYSYGKREDSSSCVPSESNWGISPQDAIAISQAGHEIGTHGWCHENYVDYLSNSGNNPDALEDLLGAAKERIYVSTGITPTTGAYPTGTQNENVRQTIARNHQFYRASLCCVSQLPPDPYRVEAVDLAQAITDGASLDWGKNLVDEAVQRRSLIVFIFHASVDPLQGLNRPSFLTDVISPLIDYVRDYEGLPFEIPIQTFQEAMLARTAKRGTASMEDTSGHAYYSALRTQSLDIARNDTSGDRAWLDYDEAGNAVYYDSTNGSNFQFRKGVSVNGSLEVDGSSFVSRAQSAFYAEGGNGLWVQRGDLDPAITPSVGSNATAPVVTVANHWAEPIFTVKNNGTAVLGGVGNLMMGQASWGAGGRTWASESNLELRSTQGHVWVKPGGSVKVVGPQGGTGTLTLATDGTIQFEDSAGVTRYRLGTNGVSVLNSSGAEVAGLSASGGLVLTDTGEGVAKTGYLVNGQLVWG